MIIQTPRPLSLLLNAWDESYLYHVWWAVQYVHEEAAFIEQKQFFIQAVSYGLQNHIFELYNEIFEKKELFEGNSNDIIVKLMEYLPNTPKEFDEIGEEGWLSTFHFPLINWLKKSPVGAKTYPSIDHYFTNREWDVVTELFHIVMGQNEPETLIRNSLNTIIRYGFSEPVNFLKRWFYLCTEAEVFWPQKSTNGFTPVPNNQNWIEASLSNVIMNKSYSTNEHCFIQWLVNEKPIEWIEFEL